VNENPTRMISQFIGNRRILVELIVVAIVLAFSVNWIASALLDLGWISADMALEIAILLAFGCTAYFGTRLLWPRRHLHEFHGFFILDSKRKELVPMWRYHYAWRLNQYLQSAFTENSTVKKTWEKGLAGGRIQFQDTEANRSDESRAVHQIISEATEYFILEELSIHLTDYFDDPAFRDRHLRILKRNDIPDVLLSNRFLEMFSKPVEDRPVFDSRGTEVKHKDQVVMAVSEEGAIYSRFSLTLPRKARVRRVSQNAIVIETDRFALSISIDFQGYSTVISHEYESYILNVNPDACQEYMITVRFQVVLKFASLLMPRGWEYYRWIESFMEAFDRRFSEDRHFLDIGWSQACTIIDCLESRSKTSDDGPGADISAHEKDGKA
jgi:hypothetical protein